MSSFLQQGKNIIANITKKKEKEGYRTGIMGDIPPVSELNNTDPDFLKTTTITNNLAQGLSNYNQANNTLSSATSAYLGDTSKYNINKNYNIFINTPKDVGEITATPYANNTCIANGLNNGALAGLIDAGAGFDAAYPNNFSNTPAGTRLAKDACKLWAADSQASTAATNPIKSYFALTKDKTTNKFKCYTGNALTGTPTQYTVKQVAYVLKNSLDATLGGFFKDGTIGVYNSNPPATPSDPSNTKNIQYINTALTGYSSCDKWVGGAINPTSIKATLGANCTNTTSSPVNIRYITIFGSSDSSITDNYIQISQLVVLAFINGASQNVATKADGKNPGVTATSGKGDVTPANTTNSGYAGSNPLWPVLGEIGNRPYPYGYHSATPSSNEWWRLDLGKEQLVYQIEYYNRGGCCNWRAQGMTMQFQDGTGAAVSVKNGTSGATTYLTFKDGSAKQTFTIGKP